MSNQFEPIGVPESTIGQASNSMTNQIYGFVFALTEISLTQRTSLTEIRYRKENITTLLKHFTG